MGLVGCVFWESILGRSDVAALGGAGGIHRRGVTDYLDGYYARIWDQQSAFGRMLDPIADKLLVASCLLKMLAADNSIHGWTLWSAIVILCREILVSGLREYLAGLRVSVPVTKLAKWKTTIQLVAIGFLIAGRAAGEQIIPMTTLIGIVLLSISAIFTIYTGSGLFPGWHSPTTSSRRMSHEGQIFRWVRERIGKAEETIEPPPGVQTIEDLMAWLAKRGETWLRLRLRTPRVIRAAIDHAHVKSDAAIAGAREIAFFPPMTGG